MRLIKDKFQYLVSFLSVVQQFQSSYNMVKRCYSVPSTKKCRRIVYINSENNRC